uniref:Uncharacterized protein n=1 Tax=Arundo donax TaxID=35708 RepID=A0A0A9FJ53_ARUDO
MLNWQLLWVEPCIVLFQLRSELCSAPLKLVAPTH